MQKNLIYTLSDPRDNKVKYIGITSKKLTVRLSGHCAETKANTKKVNWIKSLKNIELKPIITEIDCVSTYEEALFFEQYWISQFRSWGFALLNLTDGGEGAKGWVPSEDYRKKRSIAYSKPLSQYDLNGNFIKHWPSQLEAARYYNVESSAIGHALKDSTRCAANFLWRRNTSGTTKIDPYIRKRNNKELIIEDMQENLIAVYNSNMDAFKIIGRPTNASLYINKGKIFRKRYKMYTR
jgi:hypothetical protein